MSTEMMNDFDIDTDAFVPMIASETTPTHTDVENTDGVVINEAPKKTSGRGSRKVVNADGTVSYGISSKTGQPRKRPGRKPKAKVS